MPECAFCESTDLTKEHLFATWIDIKFAPSWTSTYTDKDYTKHTWPSVELDFQAKVVCGNCNNTWMSEIETKHAQPVITPMMVGHIGIPVDKTMAQSLAIFAFKTAIVADMSRRRKTPFFPRRIRHAFRTSFYIPSSVFMWMAAYVGRDSKINLEVGYLHGTPPSSYPSEYYIMTCAIGHFAFQVLALNPVPLTRLDLRVPLTIWQYPSGLNLSKGSCGQPAMGSWASKSFSSSTTGGTRLSDCDSLCCPVTAFL